MPKEQFKRGTYIDKGGHLIEVYVREIQHERVEDRRRVRERTGQLAFCIGDVYVASGGGLGPKQIVWRDGLHVKLEDKIDKILARIEKEHASLVEWDRRKAESARRSRDSEARPRGPRTRGS